MLVSVQGKDFTVPDTATTRSEAVVIIAKDTAVVASGWENGAAQVVRNIPHLPRNARSPEELQAFLISKLFCCPDAIFIGQPTPAT